MLHLDSFSAVDFRRLDAVRADHCVSLYLPTHTVSRETAQDRVLFRNLMGEAIGQLVRAGADKRRVDALARPAGRQPVAVSHRGATLEEAYSGAVEKLTRALESTLGRASDHKGGASIRTDSGL